MAPGPHRPERPGPPEGVGEPSPHRGRLHLPQLHNCDGGEQRHGRLHPDRQARVQAQTQRLTQLAPVASQSQGKVAMIYSLFSLPVFSAHQCLHSDP